MALKLVFWCEDILEAIEHIRSFVDDQSFENYLEDEMLRAAVERKLEIIGEAVSRIAKRDRAIAERISTHRQIVNFRNVLSHEYDVISYEQVWKIVQNDLIILRKEVEALLNELEQEQ